VLLAWLYRRPNNQYRFAVQRLDEAGQPKAPPVEVPEDYSLIDPKGQISGIWTGDRYRLAYGAVELGGNLRVRQVEFRDGRLEAPTFFSDRDEGQNQPVLLRSQDRVFACYTSSSIDGSGSGIACREGTGPWAAVNLTTQGDQSAPDLALLTDGSLLVVWMHGTREIRGRFADRDLEFAIEEVPDVPGALLGRPRVAALVNTAMVVFEAMGFPSGADVDGTGIYGRPIDKTVVPPVRTLSQINNTDPTRPTPI
jgi:hypothetical protein